MTQLTGRNLYWLNLPQVVIFFGSASLQGQALHQVAVSYPALDPEASNPLPQTGTSVGQNLYDRSKPKDTDPLYAIPGSPEVSVVATLEEALAVAAGVIQAHTGLINPDLDDQKLHNGSLDLMIAPVQDDYGEISEYKVLCQVRSVVTNGFFSKVPFKRFERVESEFPNRGVWSEETGDSLTSGGIKRGFFTIQYNENLLAGLADKLREGDRVSFVEKIKTRAFSGHLTGKYYPSEIFPGHPHHLVFLGHKDPWIAPTATSEMLFYDLVTGKNVITTLKEIYDNAYSRELLYRLQNNATSPSTDPEISNSGFSRFLSEGPDGLELYNSLNRGDEILIKDPNGYNLLCYDDRRYGIKVFRNVTGGNEQSLTPEQLFQLTQGKEVWVSRNPNPPEPPRNFTPESTAMSGFLKASDAASHQFRGLEERLKVCTADNPETAVTVQNEIAQVAQLEALSYQIALANDRRTELNNIKAIRSISYDSPWVTGLIAVPSGAVLEGFEGLSDKDLQFTIHNDGQLNQETRDISIQVKKDADESHSMECRISVSSENEGWSIFRQLLESAYGQLVQYYPPMVVIDHRLPSNAEPKDGIMHSGHWDLFSAKVENGEVIISCKGSFYRQRDLILGLIWGHDLREK